MPGKLPSLCVPILSEEPRSRLKGLITTPFQQEIRTTVPLKFSAIPDCSAGLDEPQRRVISGRLKARSMRHNGASRA